MYVLTTRKRKRQYTTMLSGFQSKLRPIQEVILLYYVCLILYYVYSKQPTASFQGKDVFSLHQKKTQTFLGQKRERKNLMVVSKSESQPFFSLDHFQLIFYYLQLANYFKLHKKFLGRKVAFFKNNAISFLRILPLGKEKQTRKMLQQLEIKLKLSENIIDNACVHA